MTSTQMGAQVDPLAMNVRRQWERLTLHIHETQFTEPRSEEGILRILMHLLYDLRYTLQIAQKFRPILIVLCVQWLDHDGEEEAKLAALALLVRPHEELFPILSAFLRKPFFSGGLLGCTSTPLSVTRLHLRLLAYYRILVACPHIPASFGWSPELLTPLMSPPHPDTGVRWLAVRCYALHNGMTEADRDDLQSRILGPTGVVDVLIEAGRTPDGKTQYLDGWILPALEEMRIQKYRQAMLEEYDFYGQGESSVRIDLECFTRRIADVHGILLLREPPYLSVASRLVKTSSVLNALRELAVCVSLGLPTLMSSPPSSGKTLLLNHLASLLYPATPNKVITLHLADTSLDARSLVGSYISSTRHSGTFEWQEGVVVRAMKHGLWLVLEDIDRASSDVLGTLIPLVESLALTKHIGTTAKLDVPGHGTVHANEGFMVFATCSITSVDGGKLPSPTFLGSNKFSCVELCAPTREDLIAIIESQCPKLGMRGAAALIRAWEVVKAIEPVPGARRIGVYDLETWCKRIESFLDFSGDEDVDMDFQEETAIDGIFPQVALREDMFLEARDVFFGAGALSDGARTYAAEVSCTFAKCLSLSREHVEWVLGQRVPELQLDKDGSGRTLALQIGKTRLPALHTSSDLLAVPQHPFAMHRPALLLTERIVTSVSFSEPVILVGETGTGKTALISHIASLLNRKLVSLNLSHQTESSDLVGGFKPVDTRVPGNNLQRRFNELFSRAFSRKKNSKFEDTVRRAVNEGKWKRAVGLWKESTRLALDKIREEPKESDLLTWKHDDARKEALVKDGNTPRKRRKVDRIVHESDWLAFKRDVQIFDVQHVQKKGKFAFGFVEGPLVEALRNGHWVLLDEINLASPETLECISSILQGPTASVVLTEQGSFAPIPRNPDFRLFACMNPATDVGKKDLPQHIRSRFTEIYVPPPDLDRETLVAIIQKYIGHCVLGDKRAILDVAEFYNAVKKLAENRELADGSNRRPHFSMRTLTRALAFTSDVVMTFGLRRALWEGFIMAFCMALDENSTIQVKGLAERHLLAPVRDIRALMAQIPAVPGNGQVENFERIGPFWLERGTLEADPVSEYILTPSVQSKLVDLARVLLTRRFPVLIEGPTSSGKTSAVEYLARRTGHRFVRLNNHEHTDIQEYLGSYVSDAETGRLVFRDGILVRALRNGDWIVLDELNLAPTDVLEALNRLLDDNRELLIPETQELVKPHPHFMLFATQNPPGLYAGRKILSRAFRNRFLEVHFEDVPQSELQTILSERCRIPNSYAQRIVSVFQELSKRRQAGRVFEMKHGFATLRDLFRWAGREAVSTQQLAQNGYMLLAERARRADDRAIVKEVIETVMKEHIDVDALYDFQSSELDFATKFGIPVPLTSAVVWTSAMRRLFVLVANALRYNEPVLLVGPTGSGKTSVCQLYAQVTSKQLLSLNCHQSTETADLIGGQRPVRSRPSSQSQLLEQMRQVLSTLQDIAPAAKQASSGEEILSLMNKCFKMSTLSKTVETSLRELKSSLQQTTALFEWHDGPLVRAMRFGDVFLLDEISLADDSVLERLNSVLEPARNIVLAERGGFDIEHTQVTAHSGFKLLATMNPGGDYGKKELSPALRNRFTEIWVPQVEKQSDRQMIIDKSWKHDGLRRYTDYVLSFTNWLSAAIGEPSFASLRDLLTWVDFSNEACNSSNRISLDLVFHHAAHLVFLDGIESSPYTSSWSSDSLNELRERGRGWLEQFVPLGEHHGQVFDGTFRRTPDMIYFGVFGVCRGPYESSISDFSLQAPTTLDNIRRLVRACQVSKPILLEGSPGVGKTSLVSALGDFSGHRLCRINLSDQTDVMDLFGSDLPVEDGRIGEFAWKDAAFLRAMQDGDWVLLDEMNLAPQPVLEGLNAVLDHRGTVFIPELGRSFAKHPEFRIFAAQNPLHQGGGRKGLPKSFLDRFTKVHVKALSADDALHICQALFPVLPIHHLQSMILFNSRLYEETMVRRSFGKEGSPWEFNIRDIIRWATLLTSPSSLQVTSHPCTHLDAVYLQRFRTERDRTRAIELFCEVFSLQKMAISSPWVSTTPQYVQFGSTILARGVYSTFPNSIELQRHLRPLACASLCIHRGWLTIISGPAGAGKTHFVRYLAAAAGCRLREFSMNSGVDPSDLLGSFEQLTDPDAAVARFEWQDGPLVQAVTDGHWLVLDNANLCSPAVLDRLNSLCEMNGVLALTERGHVQGELKTLKPHPEFRLILTLDPRNGELSRAMRNRGVEIYLPVGSFSQQDRLRIQSANRIPLCDEITQQVQADSLAARFELLRRGVTQSLRLDDNQALGTVRGSLLSQDSMSSAVLDQTTFHRLLPQDPHVNAYAHALFLLRLTPPSQIPILRRMFCILSDNTDAKTFELTALMERLHHTSIWELRCTIEKLMSRTRGIPLSFMFDQPFDFFMNPHLIIQDDDNSLKVQQQLLSNAIEAFVHVRFADHREESGLSSKDSMFYQSRLFHFDKSAVMNPTPGMLAIFPLYASIMEFAYDALETVKAQHGREQLSLIGDVKHLVDIAEHLRKYSSGTQFDFTSARVISIWLCDTLALNSKLRQSPVLLHAGTLQSVVSLTSGQGMQEIWRNLVVQKLPRSIVSVAIRLDHLGVNLDPKRPSCYKLRIDALNAIALLTLKMTPSTSERESLMALCSDVEQRHVAHGGIHPEVPPVFSNQIAVSELDFLSTVLTAVDPYAGLRKGNFLVQLTSRTTHASILRVAQVQHYIWASEDPGDHPVNQLAILASLLKQYFLSLNDVSFSDRAQKSVRGPGILLKPILLYNTIRTCRLDRTLDSFEVYEDSLRLEGQFVVNRSGTELRDRMFQIIDVWKGTILLIARCFFNETNSLDTVQAMMKAASQCGPFQTCSDLIELSRLSHPHLSRIVLERLLPASRRLEAAQAEFEKISCSGMAWIAMGLTLLELYVPNVPLDPVAAQKCILEFWKLREVEILAQINIHTAAERMTTGNDDSHIIATLRNRWNIVHSKSQSFVDHSISRDLDIDGLHALHGELTTFLSQVVASAKLDAVIRDLEVEEENAEPRALMIISIITEFISRVEVTYPHLADIIEPVSMALSHLVFGLHLLLEGLRHRAAKPRLVEQLRILIRFPTMAVMDSIHTEAFCDTSSSIQLLLNITATAYGVQLLETSSTTKFRNLDDLNNRLMKLWLEDLDDEEKALQESQCLYRRKNQDYDMQQGHKAEEEEFREMFPTFDPEDAEVPQGASTYILQPVVPSRRRRLSERDLDRVYRIHLWITDPTHPEQQDDVYNEFYELRNDWVYHSLDSHFSWFSQIVDEECLPYQVSLLSNAIKDLKGDRSMKRGVYNFYHDSNVIEVQRAILVVRSIQARLHELLQEWSDHMVLHNIYARCEAILKLDLHSSVAKILTALEQLHLQTEDWELYANRDNTLKPQQAMLSALIVEWRRLELSCWSQLLEAQSLAFSAGKAEWWFRFYDVTIRGTLASTTDGIVSLDAYLTSMIPLIEHFISEGPLGQYNARVRLLKSLSRYAERLSSIKTGFESDALTRVSRILHSLRGFYDQFSNTISSALAEKRSILEKEISDFIKLASWKDVNVHAMKQSAQHTHRQLYKCVRKFRELLREPVTAFFSHKSLETEIHNIDQPNPEFVSLAALTHVKFPTSQLSRDTAPYLLNAGRMFSKFKALLVSHGQPMVNAVSFNDVEDLAAQIVSTLTTLSTDTNAAGDNRRIHKTLVMRKRRAWIELLKELKRSGLLPRLRPETITQQHSKVWLMDRPTPALPAHVSFSNIVHKGEEYFNRILILIPELRSSLVSHHKDLPTRELERAVSFAESSFSLALSARNRFATDYLFYQDVDRIVRRLKHLSTSQGTIHVTKDLVLWLELCCKLEFALRELSSTCADFFGNISPPSSTVVQAIAVHLHLIRSSQQTLSAVYDSACKTCWGLVDSDELRLLDEARANILSTKNTVQGWTSQEPRIRHLCDPFLTWFESNLAIVKNRDADEPSNEITQTARPIERLLVLVQDILTSNISSKLSSVEGPSDRYISESEKISSSISSILSLESVSKVLSSFVQELSLSSTTMRTEKIQTVLPFVDAYLSIVHNHLLVQARFSKGLLKLSYILCSIFHSLSTQGFCKPPGTEEGPGGHGDGTAVQTGTGIGQGTGSENISDQIDDESQVEGLRGDETGEGRPQDNGPKEDGIEMADDFGGTLEDVHDDEIKEGSDADGEPGTEETVGNIDPSDLDAVDEKLWGGDNVTEEAIKGQISKSRAETQEKDPEVVARDDDEMNSKERSDLEKRTIPDGQIDDDQQNDDNIPEDHQMDAGLRMEDYVPETDTLNLPDDLDLAVDEDGKEAESYDAEDDLMIEDGPDTSAHDVDDGKLAPEDVEVPSSPVSSQTLQPAEEAGDGQTEVLVMSWPDSSSIKNGTGTTSQGTLTSSADLAADVETSLQGKAEGGATNEQHEPIENVLRGDETLDARTPRVINDARRQDPISADHVGVFQEPSCNIPNPLRSLGDTLRELQRRFDKIGDAIDPETSLQSEARDVRRQVEYLQEGMEEEHGLQAFGPAKEDQIAKLRELKIADAQPSPNPPEHVDSEHSGVDPQGVPPQDGVHVDVDSSSPTKSTDAKGTITEDSPLNRGDVLLSSYSRDEGPVTTPEVMGGSKDDLNPEQLVELAVREWQEAGHSDSRAAEMWRLYDSLTQELSYSLCEQLRLILEPTLATRLRGDYRTGKRLNMKKIIPYIASEYTKDKIWLRRTRPSQREYQILIALDDSRSMAESRSIHLAYETLALVSKALNRLESGEVAIARFGESVEMVHHFEEGMVGDREGEKVMRKFRFEQRKTDVLGLVEASLKALTQARERRSMGNPCGDPSELWQLEIIISDGICQDHDKLRMALRKAEELRIMIVFIVVDSLHPHHASSPSGDISQNTILSMSRVSYEDAGGGHMELKMERYLDTFPFQYYVVLRSVDALPDVLSGTLKQFFQRISEE